MKYTLTIACIAVVLTLATPRVGEANNGITEFQFPYSEVDYIPCLNEEVEFNVTVTVRTHLVVAQNGSIHYVEHWFLDGTATGLSSGLNWYGHAVSPYSPNFNGLQLKDGWNLEAMYEPLDGGSRFRKSQRLRLVQDANGITRVERFEPYQFRCLGN